MKRLNNLFNRKEEPIKTYEDFWLWFQKNEKTFHKAVKDHATKGHTKVEKVFFERLSPKLDELKEGYFFLTGMFDDHTVELVLTADGAIRNMVFVEALVKASPVIPGWKFTALKPPLDIEHFVLNMADHVFDKDSLFFYSNDSPDFPDEIDITIVHRDFNEENESVINNGSYLFLDNFLGELNFATTIDNLSVIGIKDAQQELVPIDKLKSFLIWRQKEFIEKYEGLRYDTENDNYSSFEAELDNGKPLIAIMNTTLLDWDSKASHPWIVCIEIKYDGKENNGMPDEETYTLLNKIEDQMMEELKPFDGYLNIGRQTADSSREIYLACKDFRKPSLVMHQIVTEYLNQLDISFDIYKDKYWQSFERFRVY
jgi:hypothetical protein